MQLGVILPYIPARVKFALKPAMPHNAPTVGQLAGHDHRVVDLDILRGVAVLMVMGPHLPAYPVWAKVGGWGVILFFVLSGFLISNLLFTEYVRSLRIDLRRFYIRRALKVYPSFYFLSLATVLYCVTWRVPFTWQSLGGELTLTQNYMGGLWGHTWSLAVEEHFYLLLPLALMLMIRTCPPRASNPFRCIPYVFGILAIGCLAARFDASRRYPIFNHSLHIARSHLCFDSLFFGVFLSYLHNFRPEVLRTLATRWRKPVFLLGTLAIMPCMILQPDNPITYTVGISLAYLSFGIILVLSLYKETLRTQASRGEKAISWIGVYSYTIYLVHVPLAMIFAGIYAKLNGAVNQYALHAIYCASTLLTGMMFSKLVELPFLRIRERLFPSRSGKLPA